MIHQSKTSDTRCLKEIAKFKYEKYFEVQQDTSNWESQLKDIFAFKAPFNFTP